MKRDESTLTFDQFHQLCLLAAMQKNKECFNNAKGGPHLTHSCCYQSLEAKILEESPIDDGSAPNDEPDNGEFANLTTLLFKQASP